MTAQRGDFARPSALADATDPRFTPAESTRLAAFDAASDAPESYAATVERMARAIFGVDHEGCPNDCWELVGADERDHYRRLAEAAFRAEHERGDGAA